MKASSACLLVNACPAVNDTVGDMSACFQNTRKNTKVVEGNTGRESDWTDVVPSCMLNLFLAAIKEKSRSDSPSRL